MGDYDVYIGKKKIDPHHWTTERTSYMGIFILAYTRGMLLDIIEVACPNRYNLNGITEQPLYGDTDSLVLQEW